MKKTIIILLALAWLSTNATAQWSYDLSFGLNASADQFQKPEGFEYSSPFIDSRWRVLATLGSKYSFDNGMSLYGEAGVLQYETYLQVDPFLNPISGGIEPPFYEILQQWIGPYLELGLEAMLYEFKKNMLLGGFGIGYSYDIWNSDLDLPIEGTGGGQIEQVLEYSATLNWITLHNLFITPSLTIQRNTKRGNKIWIKAKYNQGLLVQHEGQFDYVRSLDFDNEIVPGSEFSFPVRLRNSFYSVSVGFTLVPKKKDWE